MVASPSELDRPVHQATVAALMGPEPETLSMSNKHLEDLYRAPEEHMQFAIQRRIMPMPDTCPSGTVCQNSEGKQ